MTHRKLFIILLTASTLVLGVVWWKSASVWTGVSAGVDGAGHTCWAGFYSGTLMVMHEESDPYRTGIFFHRWHRHDSPADMDRLYVSGFNHITSRYSPWADEWRETFILSAPLWFFYLLFPGMTFFVVRRLEHRSGSGKEKELASRAARNESSPVTSAP